MKVLAKQLKAKQKNKSVDFLACCQVITCKFISKLLTGKGLKLSKASNRTRGNIPERGVMRACEGAIATRQGRGTIWADQEF